MIKFTEEEVKKANILYYGGDTVEHYRRRAGSLLNPQRQETIKKILKDINGNNRDKYFLDIGTGVGHVLKNAIPIFKKCIGVDLTYNFISQLKKEMPALNLVCGDGQKLPFKENIFDCVSMYALLHHTINPDFLFSEAYRVLKKDGYLYTDHDPNYFSYRFYYFFYKMIYFKKYGYGNLHAELAEYHHTQTAGLNPVKLKDALERIGFEEVIVNYRLTNNPDLPMMQKLLIIFLHFLSNIRPCRSFFTHFYIIAKK